MHIHTCAHIVSTDSCTCALTLRQNAGWDRSPSFDIARFKTNVLFSCFIEMPGLEKKKIFEKVFKEYFFFASTYFIINRVEGMQWILS